MSDEKTNPAKPKDVHETIEEVLKRIQSIYSVNGKFRAQLVNKKEGDWVCEIWSEGRDGDRDRPMFRNVQPFATRDEALKMARKCFLDITGDDRYIAKEDLSKKKEPY